jgi:hypothetical protein
VSNDQPAKPRGGKFVRRRTCLVPTWRGSLVLLLAGGLLLWVLVRGAHPFLALQAPIPGGVLAVEGWAPDYALAETLAEFKRNSYQKLYVTGGPLDQGAPLSEYRTCAELGAAILVRMGLDSNVVQAVPAPAVRQDRTYASAVALRRWLQEHQVKATNVNVISVGPHARRTRLLFEKALGPEATVGILAVEERDYDPQRWWKSSAGFRTVTDELIAYAYARWLFRPAPE